MAEPAHTYAYVSNYNSNTISVISTDSLSKIIDIKTDSKPSNIIVNPAGTYLYVAYDGAAFVDVYSTIDYSRAKRITTSTGAQLTRMTMNSAGTMLYLTLFSDSNVIAIDTTTNTIINSVHLELDGSDVNPYELTYYNGYLYVGCYNSPHSWYGQFYKLDASTLATIKNYQNINEPFYIPGASVVNVDQNKLIVNNNNCTMTVIDLNTDQVSGIISTGVDSPTSFYDADCTISMNTTGYTYRALLEYNKIAICNGTNVVGNISLESGSTPWGLACNNYNNTVFVAGNGNGKLYVISMDTNTVIASGYIGNNPYMVAIGTQAVPVQHQVKFVVQSMFGIINYSDATVTVYDSNNILQYSKNTDTTGQTAFYLQPAELYTIKVLSQKDITAKT
jgi:YVTN family beta-propeller protein